MAAHESPELEQIWNRFHEVVNLTSRELTDWLGTQPDLDTRPGSDRPPPLGVAVLSILRKRRVDLTDDDVVTMQKVIDVVEEETEGVPEEQLTDERRRHRLLNVGHDPLR